MKILSLLIGSVGLLLSVNAFAQQQTKPWSSESEASIVQVGGNTMSESYSAKQKTSYKIEANVVAITGRYLQNKSAGVEAAKQWEAAIRYERELQTNWA